MITNLMIKGKYKIETDKFGNFVVQGKKLNIKKIPFVRYRLTCYGETETEYIKSIKRVFYHSVHLVEVLLNKDVVNEVKRVKSAFSRIPIYLLIHISDDKLNGLPEEDVSLLENCVDNDIKFDGVILYDMSSRLSPIEANRLRRQISDCLGISMGDIGICNSPLSHLEENACLTAVKAREIAMDYYDGFGEWPLPTANHQSMECCCCIRHIDVNEDIVCHSRNKGEREGNENKSAGGKMVLSFKAFLQSKKGR